MKVLCGTDIIEIQRIKESIEELGDKFINRIYTKDEIAYCESKNAQKFQHYAARFAAKESIFKAISELLEDKYEMAWKNIEIVNDERLKPRVHFKDLVLPQLKQLDLSISHCKEYAVALVTAVIEE